VAAGETVTVELEADEEPRTVEVPAVLEAALKDDPAAAAAFAELSYSHRKELADWIAGAKRKDTRDRRVAKTIERLTQL
jgi:uncharacterized protein YdeI (YjbR/CyaY-like superfamily)